MKLPERRSAGRAALPLALAFAVLTPLLAVAQSAPVDSAVSPRAEEARAAQNPLATRISLTVQNNANFNFGPREGALEIVNLQPVVPIRLDEDWNIITRTAIPLVSQPGFARSSDTIAGFGPTQVSLFLSPTRLVNSMVLGAGPVIQLPTTTNAILGSIRWGAGPAAAALVLRGPWIAGALINNVWTFANDSPAARNIMTLQPIINYNFDQGTYLTSAPSIRASWDAQAGNRWIVPVGGGVGQIFLLGARPVNALVSAYCNVVRPSIGPDWLFRFQVQLLF
jgi:hypothetical protein